MPENYSDKKLGLALVGLGSYSEGQLGPALQETKHCYLAGIVTGSDKKSKKWKEQYKLKEANIYNYENFDSIRDNPEIDIVYIVLPNALHADFTIRAAKAGKHVICEKPMAVTVSECDRMLKACREAGKLLSIGYRLHFEPYNKELMRLGQQQVFGAIKELSVDHGMSETSGWRTDKKLAGGGPLMDVGIYCVQAVRYITGAEPLVVRAREEEKKHADKYPSIEEALNWDMEMPGGWVAHCRTSYSKKMNAIKAKAEKGWFEIEPAFGYEGQKGKTSEGPLEFPQVNQQALQMDDFALAIKEGRPSPVPGEMGRQDVRILEAIYRAMASGKREEL